MSKAPGFATVLAVALSFTVVSCSGPVIFKSPVAATTATAPSATTKAAASIGVGSSAPKPIVAGATVAGATVAGTPTTGVLIASATMPTTQDATTQPAPTDPVATVPPPSPWNGAAIFGMFALVLLITIWILNICFSRSSAKQ